MSNHKIENATLDWNEVGTPVSNDFDDVYFSNTNGLEETRYVFLQQNHLPQRWTEFQSRRFVTGETGFGTGLNFLAVWQWFKEFRTNNPEAPLKELHFISFEKFPVTRSDLEKAHAAWPELAELAAELRENYPIAVADCHRLVLADGMITLDLWFGDIKDCMPQVWMGDEGLIDAWFLDGFAPSKNPEMWNQELFNNMAKLAKVDCTCATFTAAGFVRRGLIEAGFDMKKVKGFGTKREMIAGRLTERKNAANHLPWFAISTKKDITDVAIIGGGIASASLALALVRRGINVTLYCQDEKPAQGASGNRQGAVYPLLHGNLETLARFFGPAFVYARQFIDQAAKNVDFDHDWCGVTQLAWDEKSKSKLDKIIAKNFTPDLVTQLNVEQTNEKAGLTVGVEGIHYPLGGWLCPQQLTQGLFDFLLRSDNFNAHFNCDITQLTELSDEKGWRLCDSQQQQYSHQAVVIANGHKVAQFTQSEKIPATPVRGQVSHTKTTEALSNIKSVLCYDGYLTPVNPNTQTHCIGASYDRHDLAIQFSETEQQENKQRLIKCLPEQTWPHEINVDDNQARVAIRSASRDHLPFVGNICQFEPLMAQYKNLQKEQQHAKDTPVYDGLFSFIGLGSRGLSSAPLLGEVLASQICGDPLPLPISILEALHPGRMWVRKLLKGRPITTNQH